MSLEPYFRTLRPDIGQLVTPATPQDYQVAIIKICCRVPKCRFGLLTITYQYQCLMWERLYSLQCVLVFTTLSAEQRPSKIGIQIIESRFSI